jgi:hypothetical protein
MNTSTHVHAAGGPEWTPGAEAAHTTEATMSTTTHARAGCGPGSDPNG